VREGWRSRCGRYPCRGARIVAVRSTSTQSQPQATIFSCDSWLFFRRIRTAPTNLANPKLFLFNNFTWRHRRLYPLLCVYIHPAKRRSSSRIRNPRFSHRNSLHQSKRRKRTEMANSPSHSECRAVTNPPARDLSYLRSNLHRQYCIFLSSLGPVSKTRRRIMEISSEQGRSRFRDCYSTATNPRIEKTTKCPPRRLSQLRVVNCRCGFLNRRGRPIVCIIINSRSTIRICILRRDGLFLFHRVLVERARCLHRQRYLEALDPFLDRIRVARAWGRAVGCRGRLLRRLGSGRRRGRGGWRMRGGNSKEVQLGQQLRGDIW
jgi:hypothetical protein